ncbi:MAG: cysteine--tRNA ligase [Planctomycetota bacterium]|jgi:cysteinyl-tRNA synthetase
MRLHNSLTGKIEKFVPLREGEALLYHCGPTVYKRQHIGNFRAFMFADLLRRVFERFGYRVTQVMNITDVGHLTEDDVADAQGEDKLQKEAQARGVDPWQIARDVEATFHEDLAALHIQPAHIYPRATEHIPEMLAMIEALVESGHAYQVDGNVYFSLESFPQYGRLSGNTLEALDAGASGRVEEREDKKNPHDFALWKHDEKHLMQWESKFGSGYPGWHIECSAMARKHLGDTIDIHTGGPDNKFPHHECEIAQSESVTGKPFVRYWMHCGWLEIGGSKMAKRAGKAYSIPELIGMGYDGRDLRYLMLKQHYRAPLPFTLELLDEAKRARATFSNFLGFELEKRPEGPEDPKITEAIDATRKRFNEALADDLNTSAAFAALHELMGAVNRAEPSAADAARVVEFFREADHVFGILDDPKAAEDLDAEIEGLIGQRDAARAAKDFATSDRIRDELKARGIELIDTAQGTRWKRA